MAQKQKFDFDSDELEGLDETEVEEQKSEDKQAILTKFPPPKPRVQQTISESAVDHVVEDVLSPEQQADGIDLDQDIHHRLEVASYYRLLFKARLFEDDDSIAAIKVQQEVMRFAEERLKALVGMGGSANIGNTQQPVKSPFSPQQVEALKALADKVLGSKNEVKPQTQEKSEPKLTSVKTTQSPQVPVAKTKLSPKISPVAKTTIPERRTIPEKRTVSTKESEKAFIEARVPKHYQNDPTLKIKNGKAFIHSKDDEGNFLFVYDPSLKETVPMEKDVTLPNRPANYRAPTVEESNAAATNSAAAMLEGGMSKLERQASKLGGPVNKHLLAEQMTVALVNSFQPSETKSEPSVNDMDF